MIAVAAVLLVTVDVVLFLSRLMVQLSDILLLPLLRLLLNLIFPPLVSVHVVVAIAARKFTINPNMVS